MLPYGYTPITTSAELLIFISRFPDIDKIPGKVQKHVDVNTMEVYLLIDLINGEKYCYSMELARRVKARRNFGNDNRQTA